MITIGMLKIMAHLYVEEKFGKKLNITEIAKKTGLTFVQVSNLIPKLKELNFIETKKVGRKTFIELTVKGRAVGELSYKVFVLFKEW